MVDQFEGVEQVAEQIKKPPVVVVFKKTDARPKADIRSKETRKPSESTAKRQKEKQEDAKGLVLECVLDQKKQAEEHERSKEQSEELVGLAFAKARFQQERKQRDGKLGEVIVFLGRDIEGACVGEVEEARGSGACVGEIGGHISLKQAPDRFVWGDSVMPTGEDLPKGEGQEKRSEEDERSSERRAIQCRLQKAEVV